MKAMFLVVLFHIRKQNMIYAMLLFALTASVVYWSDFLAADPEVPGSISGAATFFE
jgi:predicted membrane-bound mannosyltransferase